MFVIYRLLMAGYAVFALTQYLVVVVENSDSRHNVIVFLTTWTYILETTFFVLGAALAVIHYIRPTALRSSKLASARGDPKDAENPPQNGHTRGADNKAFVNDPDSKENGRSESQPQSLKMKDLRGKQGNGLGDNTNARSDVGDEESECTPWYVKTYWAVSNMIQVFALVVTAIYFGALYRPAEGKDISLHDINVHGISSVLILLDTAVAARPVRLLHVIYPTVYGFAYVLFSVIYWSQDHANNVLYQNVLDWNVPGVTVGVVFGLCFLGLPLLQLLHYGLFKLRLAVYSKVYGERYM